jgi:hypothetical protein
VGDSSPAAALDDFPTWGISLDGINKFIASHGGKDAFGGKTTTQVCDDIMKDATRATQRSYCEQQRGEPFIASATVFVSHAWLYEFLDVVAALENWAARRR